MFLLFSQTNGILDISQFYLDFRPPPLCHQHVWQLCHSFEVIVVVPRCNTGINQKTHSVVSSDDNKIIPSCISQSSSEEFIIMLRFLCLAVRKRHQGMEAPSLLPSYSALLNLISPSLLSFVQCRQTVRVAMDENIFRCSGIF